MKNFAASVFIGLLVVCSAIAQNRQNVNRDPDAVKFVTSDLDNFWRAFDLAAKEEDKAKKAAIFQAEYLDKGSPGLKDFIRLRIKSAETLTDAITKMPGFYASVRKPSADVAKMTGRLRKSFRKFKKIYPDAVFPDVYFLIGISNTGGTTGPSGLLIGTEMYSRSPQTPTEELPDWLKTVLSSTDKIPAIVAHESCHYNQSYPQQVTVLDKSIQEGSCDLISELIAGDIINETQRIHGDAHESELWQQFMADKDTRNLRNWMYNGSTVKDKPGDLGYYIGYRIATNYYRNARDKKQAVRDILNIKDFGKFLVDSGYSGNSAGKAGGR